MSPKEGLLINEHELFKKLTNNSYRIKFECNYLVETIPVHSKLYTWFKVNEPVCSYIGSANYTQNAFGKYQRELMSSTDPQKGRGYFMELLNEAVECNTETIEEMIDLYETSYKVTRGGTVKKKTKKGKDGIVKTTSVEMPKITISLLDDKGRLYERSGLNWGQRPKRNPNQAYIRLTSKIYKTDFFPEVAKHFTILTDDGKTLIGTRAQDNGKAIETPLNNSLLGEYFRNRLGLPNGAKVGKTDLLKYGRTEMDFYKIDDETYFMDFSV